MTKDKIKNNIKKLLGIKPYNDTTNFLIGDGYFSKSIKEECIKNGFDYNKLLMEAQNDSGN